MFVIYKIIIISCFFTIECIGKNELITENTKSSKNELITENTKFSKNELITENTKSISLECDYYFDIPTTIIFLHFKNKTWNVIYNIYINETITAAFFLKTDKYSPNLYNKSFIKSFTIRYVNKQDSGYYYINIKNKKIDIKYFFQLFFIENFNNKVFPYNNILLIPSIKDNYISFKNKKINRNLNNSNDIYFISMAILIYFLIFL